MRRIKRYRVEGPNSLWHWPKAVSPFKTVKNFLVIQIGRYCPSLRFKNFLYKTFLKSTVGRHTSIGLMVMFDIFFPEKIKIGDNVIIGYNSTVLCHEFIQEEYRLGEVEIQSGATIGANCTILPGIIIGEGATVSACSLVNKDIPPNAFAGGVPARIIDKK